MDIKKAAKEYLELRQKIRASGMPPHPDYWVRSIEDAEAKLSLALSAAAPQVVADERSQLTDKELADPEYMRAYVESCNDSFNEAMKEIVHLRAALAAAPVQAQEPAAEVTVGGLGIFDIRPLTLWAELPVGTKLYRAPVQPVAVPDGWRAAIGSLMDFAPTNEGPLPGMTRGGNWLRKHDVIEALSNIAAPAAQGDAETARQAAFKEAIEACYKTVADRAKVRHIGDAAHYSACADAIRAIAAKEAS